MALGAAVFIFAPMIAMGLEKAGILESYQLSRILVWKNPEAYPDVYKRQIPWWIF